MSIHVTNIHAGTQLAIVLHTTHLKQTGKCKHLLLMVGTPHYRKHVPPDPPQFFTHAPARLYFLVILEILFRMTQADFLSVAQNY